MLTNNEIQALYDEVRPDSIADNFSYTGIQLNAILPALKRMDIFKNVQLVVCETPFGPDKSKRFDMVQLDNSLDPQKIVYIYSLHFSPGIFRENLTALPHGVYILPPKVSEQDFKLKRSIIAEIDHEHITDARFHSEVIIESAGQLLDKWTENAVNIGNIKKKLIEDFAAKVDKIFEMDFNTFSDDSVSDVLRFGKVFIRMSDDSYTLSGGENSMQEYNTFYEVAKVVDYSNLPF